MINIFMYIYILMTCLAVEEYGSIFSLEGPLDYGFYILFVDILVCVV